MCRHHRRMPHRLRHRGSDSNPGWGHRPRWIPLQLKVVRPPPRLDPRTTTVWRVRHRRDPTRAAGDPLMVSGRPHPPVRSRRDSAASLNGPPRRQVGTTSGRPFRLAMTAKVHPVRIARAAGRRPSGPDRRPAGSSMIRRRPVSGRGRPRCSRAVTSARHRFETTSRAGYPRARHRRVGPGTPRRPIRARSARAPLRRLLCRNAASNAQRTGARAEPGRVSRAGVSRVAGHSSGAPSPPRRARGAGRTQIRSAAVSWCPPAGFRHRAAGAAPCSSAVSG